MLYKHSRWSVGVLLDDDTIKKNWTVTLASETDQWQTSNEDASDHSRQNDHDPPCPEFNLFRSSDLEAGVSVMDENLPSYQQRKEDTNSNRMAKRNLQLERDHHMQIEVLRKSGL